MQGAYKDDIPVLLPGLPVQRSIAKRQEAQVVERPVIEGFEVGVARPAGVSRERDQHSGPSYTGALSKMERTQED